MADEGICELAIPDEEEEEMVVEDHAPDVIPPYEDTPPKTWAETACPNVKVDAAKVIRIARFISVLHW